MRETESVHTSDPMRRQDKCESKTMCDGWLYIETKNWGGDKKKKKEVWDKTRKLTMYMNERKGAR
jgi:hypothetical protein